MGEADGDGTPVLVVDDDPDLCALVAGLLRPLGHHVRTASTATDALAAARRQRPALVILDVHLPDISGYEVCRELRDAFGEDLPIVFLSGVRTEEFDRTAGVLLGADDYLTKPFAAGELIARVRRALDRAGGRAAGFGSGLTSRERAVLELLAQGKTQRRIASELFITQKTVASHIQHVLAKLQVHSRAEAVAYAHRNRLFDAR